MADPERIIVVGEPSARLDEVLPFLASLPGVIAYNPNVPSVTLRRTRGFLTLYSDCVYITKVGDAAEGLELLDSLAAAINATWEHRAELRPRTTRTKAPTPLEVWALLPQTNCRRCGQLTCMAFAVSMLQRSSSLAECTPARDDAAYKERRAVLEAML
jgi:ArsR family metal-binding transcriptional regulator